MDGQAKEWFEAYKLRQVVSDWHEFISDVEAHFGVGDLPPSTTILGADHLNVVVHASEDISPNVMDTTVESTEPTPLNGHSINDKESTHVVHDDAGSKHHSVALPAATNHVLDRMLAGLTTKEQVQVKNELSSVMECSDDDNNEPNKATHVITPGAPPLTTGPLSKVYPSVSPSSEIQGGYLICFEDTHLVITKMSQLLWKPQYGALKPRLNLWQSQSSGSMVSKLRENGFWMFNLFFVLVLRKTRESNLLPSYTEKHLKMVVLALPKVAARCQWDPGILKFIPGNFILDIGKVTSQALHIGMSKLTVADSGLHRDILLSYWLHSCTVLEGSEVLLYNHVNQKSQISTYMPGIQCPYSLALWNWDPGISTMAVNDCLIEQHIFAFGAASGSLERSVAVYFLSLTWHWSSGFSSIFKIWDPGVSHQFMSGSPWFTCILFWCGASEVWRSLRREKLNIWWSLEVIFLMNNLNKVELAYFTPGLALAQVCIVRRMWYGAWLLTYQAVAECIDVQTISLSYYKIQMPKLVRIVFHAWSKGCHFLLGWVDNTRAQQGRYTDRCTCQGVNLNSSTLIYRNIFDGELTHQLRVLSWTATAQTWKQMGVKHSREVHQA
jgi:hypothetical protein